MTQKFVAITCIGSEYLYSRSTMIAVPTKSAQLIANALNEISYHLKAGQTWWVYENDYVSDDWIEKEIKRFPRRGGKMKVYEYEHTW